MRQHVNPLSSNFEEFEPIPPLFEIFKDPQLPLHLDLGTGSGGFLFKLAERNRDWNYLGIEIRKKLVSNAKTKLKYTDLENLYFSFGNANILLSDFIEKSPKDILRSVSFNFPDPWFKKRHFKRRIIQPEFVKVISKIMPLGSLLLIKSDVKELFEYMEFIILNSLIFQKSEKLNPLLEKSFNPQKIKTEREQYALSNKLIIYEQTYTKIIS